MRIGGGRVLCVDRRVVYGGGRVVFGRGRVVCGGGRVVCGGGRVVCGGGRVEMVSNGKRSTFEIFCVPERSPGVGCIKGV